MELSQFITPETVVFLNNQEKIPAIRTLINKATALFQLSHPSIFASAVMEREKMISTGIGMGVAIPHASASGLDDYFIITGVARLPIDWDAIDAQPVSIIFLLGIPDHVFGKPQQTKQYLQIISKLMLVIKNNRYRHRIVTADSPQTVSEIFMVQQTQ